MAPTRLTRRRALQLTGPLALSFLPVPLIGACSSSSAGGHPETGEKELPPWEFDPNESWWMQHNYAPVEDERTEDELQVEGEIPRELDGLYLRTGSNPKNGDPGHWFLGNGMVHGVRLKGGKALWYRNRYVQTPLLDRAPDGSVGVPTNTDTASNVALVHHGGRLLALGEVGFPYELSPDDLSTVGAYDFAGKLTTYMTAHPKVDPATGELLFFGYNFAKPFLTYHAADASGALVKSEPIDLPASVMMHDFQATATKIVFLDLPIVFDFEGAVTGSSFPFKWNDSHEPRIGIMPRDGGSADVKWVTLDSCFVFHTLNAYDDPSGKVILEAVRHPAGLWSDGPSQLGSRPTLHRFVIDADAGTVKTYELDDRLVEFPQLDRRKMTIEHRYGYGLWLNDPGDDGNLAGMKGIIKWDRKNGSTSVHAFSTALQPDETFFVPRTAKAAEDDGFLMTYVYDRRTDRTDLYILDATYLAGEPIAKVKLPFRVPFGFHGLWVPA